MYVCMFVYLYVCMFASPLDRATLARIHDTVSPLTHVSVCVYVYLCKYTHTYMHAHIHTRYPEHGKVVISSRKAYTHVHEYSFIAMHIYIDVYMHTHMHTRYTCTRTGL